MIIRTSALALALALVASTCVLAAGDKISFTAQQQQTLGIRVAPLIKAEGISGQLVQAQVTVPPEQLRIISASLEGMVEQLSVSEGDHVKAGDVIARLQSPQLLQLQRDLLQSLSQQRLALSEWNRDKELFNEGVIAQRRYLETKSRYQEQNAALEERRQALRLAGMDKRDVSQLETSRQLTTQLKVRSPINGVVLERMSEPGHRLAVADPLYRIADTSQLWLEIRAPIEAVRNLATDSLVQASNKPVSGKVIAVGHDVDPASQTVLVRAKVTDGTPLLWPGEYLQVSLATAATTPLYQVPAGAIARSGDKVVIFVQEKDGFSAVPIKLVASQGGNSVIEGPLKGDERVAVSGIAAIKGAWLGLGGGE
ncbi:MAG TPA: efflux RND transporter periplasmic adaptor subunit [Gammaproteobacteria bacterium]